MSNPIEATIRGIDFANRIIFKLDRDELDREITGGCGQDYRDEAESLTEHCFVCRVAAVRECFHCGVQCCERHLIHEFKVGF